MRIISQDGSKDFPYDRCIVYAFDGTVYCTIGKRDDFEMAKYATQERAIEVMKEIRMDHYQSVEEELAYNWQFPSE
jgi:hypothetical protein